LMGVLIDSTGSRSPLPLFVKKVRRGLAHRCLSYR
jgi:hypothetical protein